MKTLKRNPKKAMVAGVIAGFAEYFGIDVTVLRVLFLAALLITGFFPLGLAYVLSIFIIPIDESVIHVHSDQTSTSSSI